MSDCLFCKIAGGEIPSQKVYEDELVYAFYDIDPQAPTHFLVIPKAHIASCGEITAENSAVVAHCFEVISKVTKDRGIAQFRVVSNCGEQAGQSVFHLHFHVLAGRDEKQERPSFAGALSNQNRVCRTWTAEGWEKVCGGALAQLVPGCLFFRVRCGENCNYMVAILRGKATK